MAQCAGFRNVGDMALGRLTGKGSGLLYHSIYVFGKAAVFWGIIGKALG